MEWSNQFVELLHLFTDLLLPTVSSASWIDLISHPRSNVLEATGLPGGTPIGVTLQVWVGLIQVHHLIAFADPTTADNLLNETLLVVHSPQLAKHFTHEMDRLWESAELGITPHIQRKLDRQRIRYENGVERRRED